MTISDLLRLPHRCVPGAMALFLFAGLGVRPVFADIRVMKNLDYLESGRAEKLDLYLPDRARGAPPSPGAVWIHGGGWAGGSKNERRADNVCGTLARAGYVCVNVEYRQGKGAWPTNLYDCKNAVRFLRAHAAEYHVDPDRIAVLGGSAGGHLALMVGLTTDEPGLEPQEPYPGVSSRVEAIVDFYGITDLLTRKKAFELTSEGSVFGAKLTENPGLWRTASPVNHVRPDSPPVLIAHGLADTTVDPSQSRELDRVLTEKGVPHQLILIEQVGHSFDLTTWNKKPLPQDLQPVVLKFLKQSLLKPDNPKDHE